jgi:hypothetical protein
VEASGEIDLESNSLVLLRRLDDDPAAVVGVGTLTDALLGNATRPPGA